MTEKRITVRYGTRAKHVNRRRHRFTINWQRTDGQHNTWQINVIEAYELLDGLTDELDKYEQEIRR